MVTFCKLLAAEYAVPLLVNLPVNAALLSNVPAFDTAAVIAPFDVNLFPLLISTVPCVIVELLVICPLTYVVPEPLIFPVLFVP